MSYFAQMQAAASEAQSILAEMQGAPAGPAATNTLLPGGAKVLGVYGNPNVVFVPVLGGGYRKKTVTQLTITRPQLAAAPAPNTNLMRLDLNPQFKYLIESVDTQDPLLWVLTLVNFAA